MVQAITSTITGATEAGSSWLYSEHPEVLFLSYDCSLALCHVHYTIFFFSSVLIALSPVVYALDGTGSTKEMKVGSSKVFWPLLLLRLSTLLVLRYWSCSLRLLTENMRARSHVIGVGVNCMLWGLVYIAFAKGVSIHS